MLTGIVGAIAMLALLHVLQELLARQFAALGARFWATGRVLMGGLAALVALGLLVSWFPFPLFLGLALAGVPGGMAMAWSGLRRRHRHPVRDQPLARGAHGIDGLLALVAVVLGVFLHRAGLAWFGGTVVAGASAAALWLMWREVQLGDRMFQRVRAGLEDAQDWPAPEAEGEEGYDPWEDDRVRGTWNGQPVRVAMLHDGALIEADLDGWPEDLRLLPAGEGLPLGEEDFDRRWSIGGPVLAARLALGAQARAKLLALARDATELKVAWGTLHFRLDGEHLPAMPELLDRIAAFSAALGDIPAERPAQLDRLLETADHEPEPRVRRGHYRLLLDDEHQRRRVLLAAAEDPEAEVRALAEEEAAELSAYR